LTFMWLSSASVSWTSGNFAKALFSLSAINFYARINGPVTKHPLLILFIAASLVSVCTLSILFLHLRSPWFCQ
jgi:hypothetical protein